MSISVRERFETAKSSWSPYLIMLAVTVFLSRLGQGLLGGASTNFLVDVLGLSGKQVLWLAGLREIPGLALIGIAALIMHWPLSRRAGLFSAADGTGIWPVRDGAFFFGLDRRGDLGQPRVPQLDAAAKLVGHGVDDQRALGAHSWLFGLDGIAGFYRRAWG